ncbi:HAMP domain-containing histidine kinase [Streptomyces rectiverticillatus]|uniref:sensor histidine kinase n=1 Tax=Streptomyces rectiverticillatus TaxID=173860 RepID=UPI0015C30C2D|nr:HAMP domain-containing sensor histidine kinase [Streptomyces rectiverticillatus]QLE73913.1 HAMP domain-containing histidine kinase [Streptomyces rectiverticillatus]
MKRAGRVRELLRPASIRGRLTWLVAVSALLPLIAGAALAAGSLRDYLAREAVDYTSRKTVAVPRLVDGDPDAQLFYAAEKLRDDPRLQVETGIEPRKERWEPGPGVTDHEPPHGDELLSLWPWTDPGSRTPSLDYILVGTEGRYLHVFNRLQNEQRRLNHLVGLLAGAVLLVTAALAGATWFVAGRVLRPVEAIRTQFAELTAHHLERRVPVPPTRDEVARLAATMNKTLDQLQAAVDQQRRFVGDASHELRSPLAALRAELEIALAHPGDAEWTAVAEAALGDTRRLQSITSDLLLLARLDATGTDGLPGAQPVDLAALVREEVRRRPEGRRALEVRIEGGAPFTVHGRHTLIARLLGNLLDNADRHAAHTVTVRLGHDAARRVAVLHVEDDGPGIHPDDRQRVFERFTRLDDARTRATGGTGLGLAIAHHIATVHRGTLEITDSPRGARFTTTLPVTDPCPAQGPTD